MSYVLLWLEGPLQSWGADSKFGRRATLNFPTRSGILGMVCNALGKAGSQEEWLSKWQGHSQTVAAYARNGVRPPLLKDFHTVGNGYDAKNPWQDLHIPKKRDGSRPSIGGGPKLTYRYYLQDMVFACVLELPDDETDVICNGLQFPVWNLFLGRKCCVPSCQIYQGLFNTEEAAFERARQLGESKGRKEIFCVKDGRHDDGETFFLNDVPLSFGLRKKYKERRVTLISS